MKKIELSAEVLSQKGVMREWATNVVNRKSLTDEQVAISEAVNDFAKNIYKTGIVTQELSQFIMTVLEPELEETPSELLSALFEEGNIQEFDEEGVYTSPKNTLMVRLSAARTGNVDKSYLDFTKGTKFSRHLQIETELPMSDLRRDGAMAIATYTLYALEAFENAKFRMIFAHIDSLIAGGDQLFTCAGTLTQEAMDAFAGYLEDRGGENSAITGLTTTLRGIRKMNGYHDWNSEEMKNSYYSKGSILPKFNGVNVAPVKPNMDNKDKNAQPLPEDSLYGIAGKIGKLSMKGELVVRPIYDEKREVIELKFSGYELSCVITKPENCAKVQIVKQ